MTGNPMLEQEQDCLDKLFLSLLAPFVYDCDDVVWRFSWGCIRTWIIADAQCLNETVSSCYISWTLRHESLIYSVLTAQQVYVLD